MSNDWTVIDTKAKKTTKIKQKKEQRELERAYQYAVHSQEKSDRQKEFDRMFTMGGDTEDIPPDMTYQQVREEKAKKAQEMRLKEQEKEEARQKEKKRLKALAAAKPPVVQKVSLAQAAKKITLAKVQATTKDLETRFPNNIDIQLKGLAEYFETTLNTTESSSLFPPLKTFTSRLGSPLEAIDSQVTKYIQEWFRKHKEGDLYDFSVFVFDMLYPPGGAKEKLETNGAGLRVLFQLVARRSPHVLHEILKRAIATLPTIDNLPPLTWFLAQAIPVSPSKALSLWYQIFFPLLLQTDNSKEHIAAQAEAAHFLTALLLDNKTLTAASVETETLMSSLQHLLSDQQKKTLNPQLAPYVATLTSPTFLFPQTIPNKCVELYLGYATTADHELRDQVLSSLFDALKDDSKHFDTLKQAYLTRKFIAHENNIMLYILHRLNSVSRTFAQEFKRYVIAIQAANNRWLEGPKASGSDKQDIAAGNVTCEASLLALEQKEAQAAAKGAKAGAPAKATAAAAAATKQKKGSSAWIFVLLLLGIVVALGAGVYTRDQHQHHY